MIVLFKQTYVKTLMVFVMFCAQVSLGQASSVVTHDELLQRIDASVKQHKQIDQQRLNEFLAANNERQKLLKQAQQRLLDAQKRQKQLKQQFDENETRLTEQNNYLTERSGQLGEVFGVVKQQAQDLSGVIQDSMISAQYPTRMSAIAFADEQRIPTLTELKGLWFLLTQEMAATAEIERFESQVAQPNGVFETSEIMRVGPFVAFDEQGRYLKYNPGSQQLEVFARQPSGAIQNQASLFYQEQQGMLAVDPSRGNLLELLGRTPTLKGRIDQAGGIGYLIISLGLLGLLIALWRILNVLFAEFQIKRQFKDINTLQANNPLGRVLTAVNDSCGNHQDQTSTEIRVDEALLKEVPRLESGLTFLKLLAAVAPLLGLLGTVTGMIGTFQSITVFGTSDPKLMAGGISQALMTTVLGLCVAIPLLFCHSLIASRVKRLIQLLQQVAFSVMADNFAASSIAQPLSSSKDSVVGESTSSATVT